MRLLAIDTSSNACSVALQLDDEVYEDHVVEPRAHTDILIPMITTLLDEQHVSVQDLDAIVLGNGPGSFIGMRIGASVAQGLSFGAGIGVIPVSSLAAIAADVCETYERDLVVVVQDAHMHEVYLGTYRRGEGGLPVAVGPERIVAVGHLPLPRAQYIGAGGAWNRYPELLAANREIIAEVLSVTVPKARQLLRLASVGEGAIPPTSLEPAYLRTKVAEKPSKRAGEQP